MRCCTSGKAVNLKNRVGSYLRNPAGPKTTLLVQRLRQVDFMVTATEQEALILERNLIKEHHPRYNMTSGMIKISSVCAWI